MVSSLLPPSRLRHRLQDGFVHVVTPPISRMPSCTQSTVPTLKVPCTEVPQPDACSHARGLSPRLTQRSIRESPNITTCQYSASATPSSPRSWQTCRSFANGFTSHRPTPSQTSPTSTCATYVPRRQDVSLTTDLCKWSQTHGGSGECVHRRPAVRDRTPRDEVRRDEPRRDVPARAAASGVETQLVSRRMRLILIDPV